MSSPGLTPPWGSLAIDSAGNLYGTTFEGGGSGSGCYFAGSGCGVVWKLAPNPDGTWKVTILHTFSGPDGRNPMAGVILDAVGNLYGTTQDGGSKDYGVVWKLAPNPDGTWTETVLHSFNYNSSIDNSDGKNPSGEIAFDATGNLYGTTESGGFPVCGVGYGCGVIWRLAPGPAGTWTESVLHYFEEGYAVDGYYPEGGVIVDAAGNLYGTTNEGGSYVVGGLVWKLAPNSDDSWTESVLHSFAGPPDGQYPLGGIIFDAAGSLYGTTQEGGSKDQYGAIWKLTPNPDGAWTETILHTFYKAPAAEPMTGLTFDTAGNLYGTTLAGGWTGSTICSLAPYSVLGCGTVFKLAPTSGGGWKTTILHTFWGQAAYPMAPLTFDGAGNLFGTTYSGDNNYGTVFEITP